MTVTESTLDNIKTDLVSGIEQHNRRRTRRWMAVAVPAVVLIATAGLIATNDSDSPTYALTEQPDGTIQVEVFPDFDDVDSLENDLEQAGLDVVVIQLRAAPSLEGVVEVVSHDNEASGAIEFQGESSPSTLRPSMERSRFSSTHRRSPATTIRPHHRCSRPVKYSKDSSAPTPPRRSPRQTSKPAPLRRAFRISTGRRSATSMPRPDQSM